MRASLLFALVFALGAASVARHPQLGSLAGLTDEYFALGAKLRINGTLGVAADEPSALRPPGYPAFVAALLWALVDDPARLPAPLFLARGRGAVYAAQSVALALAASALYLWLATRLRDGVAWCAAAALGASPLAIVVVGLLHYDVAHWLLMVLACWATDAALRRSGPADVALAGAGVLWGLSNLVRPVTQLLPVFLLAGLLLVARRRLRDSLRACAMLTLGLVLSLVPWTLRNYRLTGRIVPVADNPWSAVWAQSARVLVPDATRYVWFDLYTHDLMPLFTRVTGAPAWDYTLQTRLNSEIEAEFKRVALRQLAERPGVFVENVARTFWSYNVDVSSVLLTAYQRTAPAAGRTTVQPSQSWFLRGDPAGLVPSPLARAFTAFHAVLSLLALAGLVLGVRARDPMVAVVASVYFCVGVTHALLALHILHYYVKLPLLLAAAGFALDRLGAVRPRLAVGAAAALVAVPAGLTAWMLLRP